MNPNHNLLSLRKPQNADDNLIPLINIVFLLLIFFMVAGQIGAQDAQQIDSPTSASRTPLDQTSLELSLDAAGELHHDGQPLSEDALVGLLQSIPQQDQPPSIVLRADRTANAEALDRVMTALRNQGIATLSLRTRLRGEP